jgi:hypothetical protein
MVSSVRIAALLGLWALAQAQESWKNSSTTINSATSYSNPDPPQDCQQDDCLRQMQNQDISFQVTAFCETYTIAGRTQLTSLPGNIVSMCTDDSNIVQYSKISSACCCVVTGTPSKHSSPTCQPNTVTVTFTPPIQTYTVTHKYV